MRLKKKDIELIKQTIQKYFSDAKVYLFGSMLDDNKRGGDIDLYIITNEEVDLLTKTKIRYFLEDNLLRPVDLIFHKDFNRLIEKEALNLGKEI